MSNRSHKLQARRARQTHARAPAPGERLAWAFHETAHALGGWDRLGWRDDPDGDTTLFEVTAPGDLCGHCLQPIPPGTQVLSSFGCYGDHDRLCPTCIRRILSTP